MPIDLTNYWSLHYADIWTNFGCWRLRFGQRAVSFRSPYSPTKDRTVQEPTPPASHQDLLNRPLFAHLATVRPDGAPQSGLMWFAWDGRRARFSHTRKRQKLRNLAHEPRISFHLVDPHNPYRTLELRGRVESIEADPDATFYRSLQERYDFVVPVIDTDDRIVITVVPTSFVAVDGGLTEKEMIALTEKLSNNRQADDSQETSDPPADEESR